MGFSAVALAEAGSVDSVSPGSPAFISIRQISNTEYEVKTLRPTADSNGKELSGLTEEFICTVPQAEGVNAFTGLSPEECLAVPGVIVLQNELTEEDAGTEGTSVAPIVALGGVQSFACFVSDNE